MLRRRRGDAAHPPTKSENERGYALTDALVALLILSLALVGTMKALQVARSATELAFETRRGEALLVYLAQAPATEAAASSGATDGFRWTVATDVTGAERPVEVCRRVLQVEGLASHRKFRADTLESCPIGAAA